MSRKVRPRQYQRVIAFTAALAGIAATAYAAPPIAPLGTPLYSFDLASPSVTGAFVSARDVLTLNLPYPLPALSGAGLGLHVAGDDLDALSGGNPFITTQTTFAIRFSVTRESTGDVPIDPALVTAGVPYNVMDQSARGHQAGDEFLTLRVFTLAAADALRGQPVSNHTMVNNNYDEGGSDFAGRPETHAKTVVVGQPQDNVDALASMDVSMMVFYSATSASPSLNNLPGSASPSGARIFRHLAGFIDVYASYAQLGLLQADDIDALVVFDFNMDGSFAGNDRVLFSLTPDSPSLSLIPGASLNAAADVFLARPGETPKLFASATSIGLAGVADDIDALEILICEVPLTCAAQHGVRAVLGDFDDDGDVDSDDLETFDDCYRGESEPYDPGCEPGDFDTDDDIDCDDGVLFVQAWTEPGTPGVPDPCRGTIPTVSQWGAFALSLVLLIAGSLMLRRANARPAVP